MIQLIDIFGFLSVLLRGLTLAAEALTIGGITFLLVIPRPAMPEPVTRRLQWFLTCSSIFLTATQLAYVAVNSTVLMALTGMSLSEVAGAGYCIAGTVIIAGAIANVVFLRTPLARILCPFAGAMVLSGSLMTSHAFGRVENRALAAALTLAHELAAAAWIGGLPYLLIALRYSESKAHSLAITARFSRMAIFSVALLVAGGIGLSLLYVGSFGAAFETTYGAMLIAKIILTVAVLGVAALNLRIVRSVRAGGTPEILPLRRFGEVEVGIGFTIFLAAAALTSAPPAIDVQTDRATAPEIAKRVRPEWPRMATPPLAELSPPTPLIPPDVRQPGSFVPGQAWAPSNPSDIAWSEYNHHWSGLIVLAIGLLSLAARRFRWARNWPLIFLGLAVFLLVRADPENWPLGPRGFWESFQVAEVAQHRTFVLLIVAFAAFEWAVQTGRIAPKRAGLVFPLVCAIGGALLLTHSHSLNNVKEEFLIELSHIPLAILAVLAGWSRWLEIRLPQFRPRVFAWVWPVCFVLIGFVLLNYREG